MRSITLLAVGLLFLGGAKAHAQTVSVEKPICVPSEENGIVRATALAGVTGQSIRLYFRWESHGDFYWVAMEPETSDRFWAILPKPEKRNEQIEFYSALVDASGKVVAFSESQSVSVTSDCKAQLGPEEIGVAENLTIGETSPGQQGKKVTAFLCDGIVTRVNSQGIRRSDEICQACVISWWEQSLPWLREKSPSLPYAQIEIFFGTDRASQKASVPEETFGIERSRSGEVHLGICKVSVPRDHKAGNIERPSIWKLELRPEPSEHMVLLSVKQLSTQNFHQRLKAALDKSKSREMLVFVHGYNVSFADAALRTAQLAYDLGLDGAPVLFSWPSKVSLARYQVDETNVEWTVPHLETFLRDLAKNSGARSIYLIAHSMGNRALTRALERIAMGMDRSTPAPFDQVVLTAPDIDADVFADIAKMLPRAGKRITLYASSNDEALKVSKTFHGYPRAGDTNPNLVVLTGIDTIDVSSVDTSFLGHSYYGDNRSVLADIFNLIRSPLSSSPDRRFGLKRRNKDGLAYWVFSP